MSLEKPEFKIKREVPIEEADGLDTFNWPWAICERLDYIAEALYEMSRGTSGKTCPQHGPIQENK